MPIIAAGGDFDTAIAQAPAISVVPKPNRPSYRNGCIAISNNAMTASCRARGI
jgi:hypothetical protein